MPPADRLGWLGAHYRFNIGGTQNLTRMGVRLYDPNLGRFLQVDPIEGGCANDYVYVHGDPINSQDLSGEVSCKSHRFRDSLANLYVQMSPNGALQWGVSLNKYRNRKQVWDMRIYVNGKQEDRKKNASYPPHGSLGAGSLHEGDVVSWNTTLTIKLKHKTLKSRDGSLPLSCTVPRIDGSN